MDESPTNFEPGSIICWSCNSISNDPAHILDCINRKQTESVLFAFRRYVFNRNYQHRKWYRKQITDSICL